MPRKKASSLPLYRNIAVSFSALTLLLIATILYFSIARATIVVTPRVQTFPVTAALTIAREPVAGGNAVLGSVFTKEVKQEGTFPTSVVREEDAKASGKVQITNTTGSAQTLVATTRFLTPEKILFRLKETVVAPARGSVAGTLVADVAGATGDVAPTRFTIPGLRPELQEKIYGETNTPITGGRRAIARVTQSDIDTARKALAAQIETAIRSDVALTMTDRPYFVLQFTPTASTLSQKLGAEAKEFSLTLTERVQGVVLSEKTLYEWLVNHMKSTLADDQRLLPFTVDGIGATVTAQNVVDGTARLLITTEGKSLVRATSPLFDHARFIGRTPEEVRALLLQHGGVADVKVKLTPFFIRRLPRLPDHIGVQVKEP